MSCSDILIRLFDSFEPPALLLDQGLRVLRVNRAGETAFGWVGDTVGRPLDEVVQLRPSDDGWDWLSSPTTPLPDPARCDAVAATSAGHLVELSAALWRLGRTGYHYLLELTPRRAPSVRPTPRYPTILAASQPDTLHFEIDTEPEGGRFGTIRQADPRTHALHGWVGRPCHEALFGRPTPCDACPVSPAGAQSGTEVLHEAGRYHAVHYEFVDEHVARVTYRHVDEELVGGLVAARMQALAEKAGLSARERSVFELLALGRSLDDIALTLGISRRTVRFHQANLLDKIGADSRLDVLRLLL